MTAHHTGNDAWVEKARAVKIEDEIARRGIKLRRQGVEHVGPCPVCGGDDRFAINPSKQVWNCRGCSKGGDNIALVQFLDGSDFKAACATLAGEPPPKAKGNGKDRDTAEARKIVAAEFTYQDESGAVAFVVVRFEFQNTDGTYIKTKEGKHKKEFRQKRPDPDQPGAWPGTSMARRSCLIACRS
jgi:DNA primase